MYQHIWHTTKLLQCIGESTIETSKNAGIIHPSKGDGMAGYRTHTALVFAGVRYISHAMTHRKSTPSPVTPPTLTLQAFKLTHQDTEILENVARKLSARSG